jgi:hypothetical protein
MPLSELLQIIAELPEILSAIGDGVKISEDFAVQLRAEYLRLKALVPN